MSVVWIPIVVSILGLVGGTIVYQIQKTVDRRNQVKQERRELYRRYVVTHVALEQSILNGSDSAMDAFVELEKLLAEIAVTAPDTVVVASEGLNKKFAILGRSRHSDGWDMEDSDYGKAIGALHLSYLDLIAAMRQDTFEDTIFDKNKLEKVFPLLLQSVGKFPF